MRGEGRGGAVGGGGGGVCSFLCLGLCVSSSLVTGMFTLDWVLNDVHMSIMAAAVILNIIVCIYRLL